MKCVAMFSRKGGVGKTSITVSAAIQLAARGKKVALLEADTQGCMLNQALRLGQDWSKTDGKFVLKPADQYGKVPRWNTFLLEPRLLVREVLSPVTLESGTSSLGSLLIAPLSVTPTDLSKVNNRFVMNEAGPNEYFARLNECVEQLKEQEFEFVFIDNTQGLSFAPGVTISWFLEAALRAKYEKQDSFHAWFISGPAWYDISLLLYEINIYGEFLPNANPVLVVNRSRRDWLHEADGQELRLGMLYRLKDLSTEGIRKALSRRIFASTLWMSAMKDRTLTAMYERFVSECDLRLALLGFSPAVEVATIAPQEHEENGFRQSADGGDHLDQLGANIACYEREFIKPAIEVALSERQQESASPAHGFHQHVKSALVNSLLEP